MLHAHGTAGEPLETAPDTKVEAIASSKTLRRVRICFKGMCGTVMLFASAADAWTLARHGLATQYRLLAQQRYDRRTWRRSSRCLYVCDCADVCICAKCTDPAQRRAAQMAKHTAQPSSGSRTWGIEFYVLNVSAPINNLQFSMALLCMLCIVFYECGGGRARRMFRNVREYCICG